MFTFSEENYLKAIYHLEQTHLSGVSTNALAKEMETKASSATDMIKKLSEKKLINYKKYQGFKLGKLGKETAIAIIRKHRLWEVFLVEKLNFSWDEVHEVAEQLEHIKSEKLTNKLDQFLEYPKTDPHGDPIPDKDGNFPKIAKRLLSECQEGDVGIFIGVKDSSPIFLRFLDKNNICINAHIKILQKEEFDLSLKIEVNKITTMVSHKTASSLYLQL